MKNIFIWFLILSHLFSIAQGQGIIFESGLSWQEVLQKAKIENKYIFVDCCASWCAPCKWMDKNVYSVDSVGAAINARFISIRIQMDSARQDNEEIQQWYATAKLFIKKYHIAAYPSYLFFSPGGEAVHKDIGKMNINDFISMCMASLDPRRQYYTLMDHYGMGIRNYALMPVLSNAAQKMDENSIAIQVAKDYINNCLAALPEKELWTKQNIIFLHRHSNSFGYNNEIFQMYYRNRSTIDSVFHEAHISDGLINHVLFRDLIQPAIDESKRTASEPQWRHLENLISLHYGVSYAQKNVLEGRIQYYKSAKKWRFYIKYFIRQQETSGIESWKPVGEKNVDLNNSAFEVFKYSINKRELKRALLWINRALTTNVNDPENNDTKANLLYKLGERREALLLEEKIHSLAPRLEDIAANYEKMKSGLPTWPNE